MTERWRPVAGFDGYFVSDHGKVLSRRVNKGSGEKILVGWIAPGGYRFVVIRDAASKPCRFSVHRLVGLAFLRKPKPGQTDVCHRDGDASNCHYRNLRWDTHQNNQMDMREHGTMQDGEKSVTAKLTERQVNKIRKEVARGPRGTARHLCGVYGISPPQMSRIVNGQRWKYNFERNAT